MTTSHTEPATDSSPDYVSGVLNYLADKEQRPGSYNFKPPEGVPARTGTYPKFTVPIHSARAIGRHGVRDLLPDTADALLKNRFAVINVWRPIRGPVQESPLAVCDAQSMVQEDFVKHVLKYRDRDGEVYSVAYNPNHRWYYVPNQQKEEVLLLKCYDSDEHRARFTAHSAFEDPTSPRDAAPRESVEIRTLVFFAPDKTS